MRAEGAVARRMCERDGDVARLSPVRERTSVRTSTILISVACSPARALRKLAITHMKGDWAREGVCKGYNATSPGSGRAKGVRKETGAVYREGGESVSLENNYAAALTCSTTKLAAWSPNLRTYERCVAIELPPIPAMYMSSVR